MTLKVESCISSTDTLLPTLYTGDVDILEQEFLRYQNDDMADMVRLDTEKEEWGSMRIDEKWGRLKTKIPI